MPGATVVAWDADDPATHDADYAVVWTPPAAFFRAQPRLRAVFNLGAGVDGLMAGDALPDGLPVVRLEDAGMADLMAEYVVQAAVRHARGLDAMEAESRAGRWSFRKPVDRADFPVGVLGAGTLGAPVALALKAHGFPVAAWSRTPKIIDGVDVFHGADGLDPLLARTRILVCLLPLTRETEDLIDARLLAKLLPDAYLINVARGAHVVDADLLAAIASGRVAGATLDVFRVEPLPADHPFWREPRIAITPHCSAQTRRRQTVEQIAAKIARMARGEAVTGVVDRARGY